MDASGCACNVTEMVGAWQQPASRGDAMPVAATPHASAPAPRSAQVMPKDVPVARVHRTRMAAMASVASVSAH
jgi:hypothetical protein